MLMQEVQARGFIGSRSTLYHAVVQLRREVLHVGLPSSSTPAATRLLRATPRRLASWVLSTKRTPEQQLLLQQASALHPSIEMAIGLAQDFLLMLRARKPQHLRPWIEAVALSSLTPLNQFAQGLLRDFPAIEAACREPWSNGQLEGQVNRLKFLKRQMYGRANFDLLRLRVLYHDIVFT
jgi:transposase